VYQIGERHQLLNVFTLGQGTPWNSVVAHALVGGPRERCLLDLPALPFQRSQHAGDFLQWTRTRSELILARRTTR
jgi:hypothetical protein